MKPFSVNGGRLPTATHQAPGETHPLPGKPQANPPKYPYASHL